MKVGAAAFQSSSILTVRGVGKWELQECLWGLDSGIICPETEAIKSLGVFSVVHAGCCCVLCLYPGAQWEVGVHGCSLQPVPSPSSPQHQPSPRCAPSRSLRDPLLSFGFCFLAALAGNICL